MGSRHQSRIGPPGGTAVRHRFGDAHRAQPGAGGVGWFLLHAASAVRNGRAFLFSGVSEAGKTTISRLAPPDVTLLTDEISYVRPGPQGFLAFGTPFAGELGTPGENIAAPIAAVSFSARTGAFPPPCPSAGGALSVAQHAVLCHDAGLVEQMFQTACEFVSRVPAYELTFKPVADVWEVIQ